MKENSKKDENRSNEYGNLYLDEEALFQMKYIGDFAGRKDVLLAIMKNGEEIYYSIEDFDEDIVVLEAKGSEEEAAWNLSEEVDSLRNVYQKFRAYGIINDLYLKRELEDQKRRALKKRKVINAKEIRRIETERKEYLVAREILETQKSLNNQKLKESKELLELIARFTITLVF